MKSANEHSQVRDHDQAFPPTIFILGITRIQTQAGIDRYVREIARAGVYQKVAVLVDAGVEIAGIARLAVLSAVGADFPGMGRSAAG